MKKLLLATSLCIFAASSHAHRVWVESTPLKAGEVLQADLGYGEFPTLETIPEKRLSFFEQGMHLLSAKGSEALKQTGGNQTEAAKLLNISLRSLRYRMLEKQ